MARPESIPNRNTVRHPRTGRFPGWIWYVYLLLFAVSVPWYLPTNAPLRIWLGLPHWVVISLLASFGVAVFTAFVVHRLWPEQPPPDS